MNSKLEFVNDMDQLVDGGGSHGNTIHVQYQPTPFHYKFNWHGCICNITVLIIPDIWQGSEPGPDHRHRLDTKQNHMGTRAWKKQR